MSAATAGSIFQVGSYVRRHSADAIDMFLTSTTVGGTSLIAQSRGGGRAALNELPEYLHVRVDVILEYERTILELRRELLHYKRLLSHLRQPVGMEEDWYAVSSAPLDARSVKLLNSLLAARTPTSSAYEDIQEGES